MAEKINLSLSSRFIVPSKDSTPNYVPVDAETRHNTEGINKQLELPVNLEMPNVTRALGKTNDYIPPAGSPVAVALAKMAAEQPIIVQTTRAIGLSTAAPSKQRIVYPSAQDKIATCLSKAPVLTHSSDDDLDLEIETTKVSKNPRIGNGKAESISKPFSTSSAPKRRGRKPAPLDAASFRKLCKNKKYDHYITGDVEVDGQFLSTEEVHDKLGKRAYSEVVDGDLAYFWVE